MDMDMDTDYMEIDDEEIFSETTVHPPSQIQTGIKRQVDSQQREEDSQPSQKQYRVDPCVAPSILDKDGYFIEDEVFKMEPSQEDSGYSEDENLLLVQNQERVPAGCTVKIPVRRCTSSSQNKGGMEFNGKDFNVEINPKKKLDF